MRKSQIIALLGSGMLIIGVFFPIISVPILGTQNYFQNGEGDGVIIIFLAIFSILLALLGKSKQLVFPGVVVLLVLGYTFVNFKIKMSQVSAQLETDLENNPFKELAELGIQSIQLQWGWAVLVLGGIALILSAQIENQVHIDEDKELQRNVDSCKHEDQSGRFCTDCGMDIEFDCNHQNQSGNFCTECGKDLRDSINR